LQTGEGDTNSSLATQKLDGSVGSAGAGSASMGQIFGAGSSSGVTDRNHIHGGNSEQNKNTIKDKQQQVVSDEQGSQSERKIEHGDYTN
jgi:hypothetical protein